MSKHDVEQTKSESHYLRGALPEELASDTDHFSDDGKTLLKFHGIYQQDNRDARKERGKDNRLYFFMVRSAVPGGRLTAEQFLLHDELCDKYGNHTFRLTSRQGIQLHGVFKNNLRNHIRALNDALVTTLSACGDVRRNVMSCPAPIHANPIRNDMQQMTLAIAEQLRPRTRSYHDVWLNGQHVPPSGDDVEPIYGKTYLPRKFKIGLALPEDNCIDLLSNDLGLLVKHDGKRVEGYDVFVGGGMGMDHGKAHTYPRLATPLCFATPDEVVDICTAVVLVQRDHGNREDRKQARMKYLIDNVGMDKFRQMVQQQHGRPLAAYTGAKATGIDDHLGWHEQGDGKLWVGVYIDSGRMHDTPSVQYRTGLREIIKKHRPSVRITAQQNLLLCDLDPKVKADVQQTLQKYGIVPVESLSLLHRQSMACPAIPTCGLALAESERNLVDIVKALEGELANLGLSNEDIVLHMTGCPNGCARPYNTDIGIVGRSPGKYKLFVGGNHLGDQLSFELKDLVPEADIAKVLRPVFTQFKQQRQAGERFGDYCQRLGQEAVIAALDAKA